MEIKIQHPLPIKTVVKTIDEYFQIIGINGDIYIVEGEQYGGVKNKKELHKNEIQFVEDYFGKRYHPIEPSTNVSFCIGNGIQKGTILSSVCSCDNWLYTISVNGKEELAWSYNITEVSFIRNYIHHD